MRALLDALVDGVIQVDHSGKIQFVNQRMERIFGYSGAELVGKDVSVLMPEPHRSQHAGYLADYLATRQPNIIGAEREVVAQHKSGTTFPIRLTVTETRTTADDPTFAGVFREAVEITDPIDSVDDEESNYLQTLQLQHAQMERLAVAGEMTATLAHEIRTPLNALAINLQMVARLLQRDHQEGPKKSGRPAPNRCAEKFSASTSWWNKA